jgi:hypothetical protein
MFHHLAHFQDFKRVVRLGTKIRRGDSLGTVGASGTRWAHLHYEVMKIKPPKWTGYIYGWTKAQVAAKYADPSEWIDKRKKIPARYETYGGYEYLDAIQNAKGDVIGYHPGVDVNWGSGHDDMGSPIVSPCTGEIVYIGKNEGGWGNHIWIKESMEVSHPQVNWDFARKLAGRFFLQVEAHGEAWYVDPEGKRHYIGGTPQEMLEFVRKQAVGITDDDLHKIPIGTNNPNK